MAGSQNQLPDNQKKLNPEYASFTSRLLAFNIDLVIFLALAVLLGMYITDDRLLYEVMGIIYLLYHFIFESSQWNGSIGKRLVGIEVASGDLADVNIKRLASRSIFKLVSALPLLLGFVLSAFHPRKQTLHDIMSGCVVIKS